MHRSNREKWLAWPPLLFLILFFVVPASTVLAYSLLERDFYGQVKPRFSPVGWQEATGTVTLKVLWRSITLAAGVAAACLLLGYPCALALAKVRQPWKRYWALLISFPVMTSLLLRIYGWMNILPSEWRGTLWAVGLVMTMNYLPFMLFPLLRSIEGMDANLTDAAIDLGATRWKTFVLVVWPVTKPGALAGLALVFIPATGDYLVPHFIGDGRLNVVGTLIVQQFMERRNWPYASAAAVWLLAMVCLPVFVWLGASRLRMFGRRLRERVR